MRRGLLHETNPIRPTQPSTCKDKASVSDTPPIKLPSPPTQSPAREKTCWQCGQTFHTDRDTCPSDGARLLDLVLDNRDLLVGQTIDGKYQVRKCLAEGGMGKVYEAYDLSERREVAIKVLKADYLRDETIRKRFMHEARIVSNLEHPNVVALYDFGQMPSGNFYMVMELLKGESLAERLANKFLSYAETFSIVTGVCDALAEAHSRGVVHRDLKPENIFIVIDAETGEEQAKLIDFGVARQAERQTLTQTGSLWGTPAYMSPEQCRGEQVTESGDTYTMGIILYELICGHLPFVASTHMGYAVKHMHEEPRAMKSAPGLTSPPDELDELVLRTLGKTAQDRPASMEIFVSELKAIIARHFPDEESLQRVPALEVDPIALKVWMKEGELEGERQVQERASSDEDSLPRVYSTEAIEFSEPVAASSSNSLVIHTRRAFGSELSSKALFIAAAVALLLVLIGLVAFFASKDDATTQASVASTMERAGKNNAPAMLGARSVQELKALEKLASEDDVLTEVEELEELEQERQQSASSAAMGQGAMVAAHVAIFAERMLSTNTVATSEPPTSKKKSTRRTRKKNSSNRPRRPTRAEKKENVQDAVKSTL